MEKNFVFIKTLICKVLSKEEKWLLRTVNSTEMFFFHDMEGKSTKNWFYDLKIYFNRKVQLHQLLSNRIGFPGCFQLSLKNNLRSLSHITVWLSFTLALGFLNFSCVGSLCPWRLGRHDDLYTTLYCWSSSSPPCTIGETQ